ncbi:lactonase family protein [Vaginisenegalia massiliensis]|uniref:lactonase family protein n=1 Tax=Vaginisenegalia massiliensis TaxID=2058294 RepID=UPI000F520D1C|nr:lactonase family protein [Vaginisenegalia massiliensis]
MQNFILGGYTKRLNDGLYEIEFDESKAKFGSKHLISPLKQSTFMTLSSDKRYLFAIHKGDENSGIVAFEKKDGHWHEIDRLLNSTIPGCHLSYRSLSRTIYVSNYHLGQIQCYQLKEDNKLTELTTIQHHGSSIHPNQKSPHVHYTCLSDDESLLYVCDLGTDHVLTYQVNAEGELSLRDQLKFPAGTGPRHLVKHPHKKYYYAIGELGNTTSLLKPDKQGRLTIEQTILNIPSDQVQASAGSAIRTSQDGRFLYVSTRFHNSLSVFEINQENGQLNFIQCIETMGQIPRDFCLDASDSFVLVPHQDSDFISIFERNPETGLLKFIQNDTKAPECVCILPV